MTIDREAHEHFDAGDLAGATRLTVRAKIAELKRQRDAALTGTMEAFYDEVPEFGEHWRYYTGLMKTWLREHGVDPACATLEDLRSAWQGIHPPRRPAPAPAQAQPVAQQPSPGTVDAEARRAIAEGRVSREIVDAMPNLEYERKSRDAIFARCIELLYPRRETPQLTRGEVVAAAAQASPVVGEGSTVAEEIRKAEIRKADEWVERYRAERAQPPAQSPRSGVINGAQQIPLPRSISNAQISAYTAREARNEALILVRRQEILQRRRDRAHRAAKH